MSRHRSTALSSLGPTPRAARRVEGGFTLVELMVALSGGLFLSMVVFALARDTTRFYQREGRIASATLAGIIGFERLKADIERAGYLSTPNVAADPLSGVPAGSLPTGLQNLAAVRITPDTPSLTGNAAFALNASAGQALAPDQIVLSGSYSATDEFAVSEASDGQTITLQPNSPPMARLGYLGTTDSAVQTALLQNVFGAAAGQILRYKNVKTGRFYLGQIASVAGGTRPTITLSTPLPITATSAGIGGVAGYGTGDSVNVVNIVRYRVMDLQHDSLGTAWTALFTASQGATGEDARTELVRDQLNSTGGVVANSTEIVAEYAVGLEFAVFGQLAIGNPTLALSVPTDSTFATYTGTRPQGIRAVRMRLSVRSREGDRAAKISGGLFRFRIGTSEWARVRNFQADIALPNQRSVRW